MQAVYKIIIILKHKRAIVHFLRVRHFAIVNKMSMFLHVLCMCSDTSFSNVTFVLHSK